MSAVARRRRRRSVAPPPAFIDVIGPSGAGKSTIAPLLADELERRLGSGTVLLDRSGPGRMRIPWSERIVATLRRPGVLRAVPTLLRAWPRKPPHRRLGRAVIRLTRRLAPSQRARRSGARLVVMDQGVFHGAKVPVEDVISALPRPLHPTAFVEVTAPRAERARRSITRDKPRPASSRATGPERLEKATRTAQALATLPTDEAHELLHRYGQERLDPPLSETEVASLLQTGRTTAATSQASTPTDGAICWAEATRGGIPILTVNNVEGRSGQLAAAAAEALSESGKAGAGQASDDVD